MIRKGDLGGALRRLMPLASDPHPSGAQRRAQQLVAWLASGGSGTPPSPGPDGTDDAEETAGD
ncbi:hypothetical protein [Sphingopyxis sp. PET50]|uniref:hypothetical protein n=1 Tax=Sphingopyxis sp. PET50 TaxID=2976533 RepID=UPI0021B07111|nr:hypothetical protein [Sphingopyxis sp. PET50]